MRVQICVLCMIFDSRYVLVFVCEVYGLYSFYMYSGALLLQTFQLRKPLYWRHHSVS